MKNLITSIFAVLLISGSLHAQRTSNVNIYSGITPTLAPDLVVTSIKVPYIPTGARVYAHNLIQLNVIVTIKNRGNEEARSGFGVYTNIKLNGKSKASSTTNRLQPGQSYTFKKRIYIPESLNGKYINLSSTADAPGLGRIPENTAPQGGMVPESNERNNTKTLRYKLYRYKKVNRRTF